jgi:hypothetical protein
LSENSPRPCVSPAYRNDRSGSQAALLRDRQIRPLSDAQLTFGTLMSALRR